MSIAVSQGYTGPTESNYLFIDGACLRNIIQDISKTYFEGADIGFNYAFFTHQFTKVFYYDALPVRKEGESDETYRQKSEALEGLFNEIGMLDRYHVNLGTMHMRRRRLEQKQVDMMIAIDMLTHAHNHNMQKATLLTSDSDFIPLLDRLVQMGMYVTLWYGETKNCKTNKELMAAADSRRKIGIDDIYVNSSVATKKRFKIPEKTEGQKDGTNAILNWNESAIGEIELCFDNGNYILSYANAAFFHRYVNIKHPNLGFLRTYVAEEYKITIPSIS